MSEVAPVKRKPGRPRNEDRIPQKINLQIPEAFTALYEPYRYKVFYGGRGGAKSWQFADALIVQCWKESKRVLCTRELQKSIRESVHHLLADRIHVLGLDSEFRITDTEIRGLNGSEIIFAGLKHNATEIKSMEGIDICWVEEGQKTSESSLDILIPTIRKPGSEIWVSMNVGQKGDPAYQRLIVNPPKGAYVKKVGWRDNPWFPDVLRKEMEDLKARDYEKYLHIWEGELQAFADGAYYKQQLIDARADGRITKVAYDPILKVYTVWDLGIGDSTAIWFAQLDGKNVRLIDYYEMSGEGLPHYAKVLQNKPYIYGNHFAPHDIRVRELGSGKSRIEQAAALGIAFDIVPNISVDDGIAAARASLPLCWFDEVKCARGLDCLANYHREWDDDRLDWRLRPEHDWSSHGADAFRYLAVGLKIKPVYKDPPKLEYTGEAGAWMR